MLPSLLILPGWTNSGPEHWQSQWERKYSNAHRVQQRDWQTPRREDWAEEIECAVAVASAPVILIAHSLGCIAVAHWASSAGRNHVTKVQSALLVAPADVDRRECPPEIANFSPIPMAKLPFASVVVASSNDPYCTIQRAKAMANAWGSEFKNIGRAGHISPSAGYGEWPKGEALLAAMMNDGQTG